MPEIKAPALHPSLLVLAEHPRNLWRIDIPPGIPIASVTDPEFWAHCNRLRQYDKIEARAQDNAWYAELLVAKVEKQSANVWVVLYADLRARERSAQPPDAVSAEQFAPAVPTAEDYKVEFGGPKHMWRVVRLSDKAVVHKGDAAEQDAQTWLDSFLKAAA